MDIVTDLAQKFSPVVAYDKRFPNTNQTKNCWINYVNYYKLQPQVQAEQEAYDNALESGQPIDLSKFPNVVKLVSYKNIFKRMCSSSMLEQWDEQRENGVFPGLPRGH